MFFAESSEDCIDGDDEPAPFVIMPPSLNTEVNIEIEIHCTGTLQ